ncbi:dCMP deaminase family protein [Ideonella sp. 4Y11]|uniref:dCMP deaminase family protein n=1 Tax=Ideonella aquatica TaxID=2824119 RepID=A0A940YQM4_9BURK|nr:dCMP deaminase family protein [Ideonella aquatica]
MLAGVNDVNKALIDWHSMFMGVALLASARSKDGLTRNGACIASADHRILGVGYNGLPRGCSDQDPVYWSDQDDDPFLSRHSYVVHAEMNAILNCVTLPLTGSRIYTTQFPCPRCTQSIIQVGITEVVWLRRKPHQQRSQEAALKMLGDAGVRILSLAEADLRADAWVQALDGYLQGAAPRF